LKFEVGPLLYLANTLDRVSEAAAEELTLATPANALWDAAKRGDLKACENAIAGGCEVLTILQIFFES